MNLKNVKLIFLREMRDQLRDRRTLFLIAVLPLLLYPLLGMSFFQLSQFMRNTAAKVLVVGEEELTQHDWMPPLLTGRGSEKQFDLALFANQPDEHARLTIADDSDNLSEKAATDFNSLDMARERLDSNDVEVVLYFPPGFGKRLDDAREALMQRGVDSEVAVPMLLPEPQIFYNSAKEKSRIAQMRVERVLSTWRSSVARTNLRDGNVPLEAARPFEMLPQDVAEVQQRHAAVWSKILPFILFIWALTGAFYPAVDLCAGEKERGTLETLLVSPAQRREIVWGKLLTVMTFSVVTAMLNLGSMGMTGKFVISQFQQISAMSGGSALAMPPAISLLWMFLALLPVSALFSALCLACASFARSTKEGQYYLMPLLLVVMPLMMLPLSPGVELTLGNSLIPVTGVVLLLRSLIEGQYLEALPYIVPVFGITMICCLLAIRWAEEQFQNESILFRESERLDLGRWLVHLVRDKAETPTFAQGVFCSGLILILIFFMNVAMSSMATGVIDFKFFFQTTFVLQAVCIALPALFMALLFTSRRKKTLLLDHWPRCSLLGAAALLAVFVRPLGLSLAEGIQKLYPISGEMESQLTEMSHLLDSAPNAWLPFLLIAILPAICEEIAFRGFILSGLRHVGHKWWAIGLSSVAFGLVHPILQQQIAAAAVGMVLGYLAVQTGSLLVCMVFHAMYNGLALAIGEFSQHANGHLLDPRWSWMFQGNGDFQPWVLALSVMGTIAVLVWLHRLPYQRTKEEQLQEARERSLVSALEG